MQILGMPKLLTIKLVIIIIVLVTACAGGNEWKSHYYANIENTLEQNIDVEISPTTLVIAKGPFTEVFTQFESRKIIFWTQTGGNCYKDDCVSYHQTQIDISNSSLSMYTFCESGSFYDNTQTTRILDISATCLENETYIISGY